MTNEEWKQVQEDIESIYYGRAKLEIDGYKVFLVVIPYGAYKKVIAVYVNGEIKGEWFTGKTDEGKEICRRFMCPHKSCLLKKSEIAKLTKRQKALLEKEREKYTYTSYSPYWSSFSRLKSHFIKNNTNISLVKENNTNE